jgi:hypothetical protein
MSKKTLMWLAVVFLVTGILGVVLGLHEYQHPQINIVWSTASEMNTAGYNLYRSKIGENEKMKINDKLIPASEDPFAGGEYQFSDHDVDAGVNYLYFLEEVELDGKKIELGTIQVEAKRDGFWLGILALILFISGCSLIFGNRKSNT